MDGHFILARAGLLVVALVGCLPDDERPDPGSAVVRAVADEALFRGSDTLDGWHVEYETLTVSIGELATTGNYNETFSVALGGIEYGNGACTPYASSDYLRLLAMRQSVAQPLSTLYALGRCRLRFRLRPPAEELVRGDGVSPETLAQFRARESDAFVTSSGIAVQLRGVARRGERELRFDWSFRDALQFDCGEQEFRTNMAPQLDIQLRPQVFFRERAEDETSVLRFGPYADADSDQNAEVTLAELARAPTIDDPTYPTLGARMYLGLLRELPAFRASEPCQVERWKPDD